MGASRLRLRLPRRRSRPRAGGPAPGPGDRSRQRQPLRSRPPWRPFWLDSKPNTATRWPRSITSLWRSATSTTPATPPHPCALATSPSFSTGSDATNQRPPSPVSPSVPSPRRLPNRHRDRPPTRCPRRPDLRIARPQGRDDDHRRIGDLRIRPDRPGANRTRTPELKRSRGSRLAHAAALGLGSIAGHRRYSFRSGASPRSVSRLLVWQAEPLPVGLGPTCPSPRTRTPRTGH